MFSVGANADKTDSTETHGFFNCVVFNNFVDLGLWHRDTQRSAEEHKGFILERGWYGFD
jgi:hypothetical protein